MKEINKFELTLTNSILESLDIEAETGYNLYYNAVPLLKNEKHFALPSSIKSIHKLSKDQVLFRPLTNERHATFLIFMLEELILKRDLELEITKKGDLYNAKYKKGKVIDMPSTALLKTMVALKLVDREEFGRLVGTCKKFYYGR